LILAATRAGGKAVLAPLEETDLSMTTGNIRPLMKRRMFQTSGSLFVYPAQSSVTGIRHSMHWISKAHKCGWHVVLDASTLLPTGSVDLRKHRPDFVVGSFQSIVGYPAGMGFLLVRRSSFLVTHAPNSNAISLTARVSAALGKDFHVVAEDESLSKLSFAGLDLGLQHLQSIGLGVINKRVRSLATWTVHKLKGLRQVDPEDWSLVNVYSPYMVENRGNIISFNILDNAGEVVSPVLVQRLAAKHQITLAVGSFCNPGVANLLGPAKSGRVKNATVFSQHSDFECLQVSLGPMSNFEDAYRLVQFIAKFRNPDFLSLNILGFIPSESLP
jgi:molybdenum cofactor sulfurtransferase